MSERPSLVDTWHEFEEIAKSRGQTLVAITLEDDERRITVTPPDEDAPVEPAPEADEAYPDEAIR